MLRTQLHRFSSFAVPPRSSSPRTSLLHLCALLSLCPPLPLAPGTASFPWCSPFGVAFSVRTRPCLSDERPPLGCAVAVPGSVAPLPGGGARRRAVRNAQRDADAVRRWGSGVAVRRCLDVPLRAQRAARPSPIGSWRRVARSGRTYRCWGCSRQRGGPPSPASGPGASPRVYVHRTLAPRSTPGYDPCDRYDAGIRTNATRGRVGWVRRAIGRTAERAQRRRSRPVDRYDMCLGTGERDRGRCAASAIPFHRNARPGRARVNGTRRPSVTVRDPWSPYPGWRGWCPTPMPGVVVQRAWSRSAHRQRGH